MTATEWGTCSLSEKVVCGRNQRRGTRRYRMGYVFAIRKSGLRPQSKEGYRMTATEGVSVRYQKKWSAAAIKGGVHDRYRMGYVFAIRKSGLRPQSKEGYTSLQKG